MAETHEDRLHREFNEHVAELTNKARGASWQDFAQYADEIEALREQLEAELTELPKSKRKWFRR